MAGKALFDRGKTILSGLAVLAVMSLSATAGAQDFPRIGIKWHNYKSVFLENDANITRALVSADVVLISPTPGKMEDEYRTKLATIRNTHPDLLVFRYMNITELSPNSGKWAPVVSVLTDYYDNPNRGGKDRANDGWLRKSDGAIVSYYKTNQSINITDYVSPYDGSRGVASSDADLSKPRAGETVLDYVSRANYYVRIRPVEDYIDGVYEDVFRRWPKMPADWNNDGTNSSKNINASPEIQRIWREAHVRNRDNMVGRTYNGKNPGNARSNGRAWLNNGGYFIGNMSAWSNASQVMDSLDSGVPLARIPEYEGVLYGGIHEGVFGRTNSSGGLAADGTEGEFLAGSFDQALTGFNFRLSHTRSIPSLGHSVAILEAYAANLQMARYIFAAGLLTDGVVNIRLYANDEPIQPPWVLDEFVGGDIGNMTPQQVYQQRKWLGEALDPAYPLNPQKNNGRVHLREFENGLVVLLAGKSHRDSHLTTTVNVSLPDPGAGYRWRRIDGSQDGGWNDGSVVGGSIKLGTKSANINKNAIILVRELARARPRAPTVTVE